MPTNTDLVTDLPADFEVFGQAVASSMADLLGGTTGQILSKATNADMDFTWIANDQGDITGVTATSPLTGGGTSGAITVGIQASSTSQSGAVQLSDSTSTTSSVLAATPTAVKAAYDLASAAAPKLVSFNAQTGTTYTFVLSDADKLVTTSNASAITVTLPPSVFSAGQTFDVQSIGVGLTTFAAGSGVTITSTGATAAAPKLRARYSASTVICMIGGATPTFTVIGDVS
ncbi:Bacteriophage lambda, Stf, side tail fibre-repeat-2 [uncultured Caudovirales phage]|uniref:Bacteriophage lambda, Stf, side tail fibre-repeat-2 n=1 Tax=uncultured Caudovirales phage TaxID=2100421 RepID=A0A6J5S6A8_9CAUD|nr:Bacteriophage lambda, Stf, side tail fibre-repeat-2 [uncultured Caudovirales phage]